MALKFITGNKNKFKEMQIMLAPLEVEQIDIDLVEIQELDPKKIIEHKLQEALKLQSGEFIVEDNSMWLEALGNKLPGPLIKWFNDTIGNDGLYSITKNFNKDKASTKTIIGYLNNSEEVLFFEGEISGRIVEPKEKGTFGYDPIFVPEGTNKTLSDLKKGGDFSYSGRGRAAKKLKEFLLK